MSPVFRHGRLRLYLLRLLAEEPRHGYEVIRLLRDQFMGVYAPSPGTIYPRLARLEEEGLVTHDEVDGRKVYRITDAGREELSSRGDELDELEQELSDSVSDIVREVKEDVRETVRSLREELTWAARETRRAEREETREQTSNAREQGRQARDSARDTARDAAAQARDTARDAAQQARERARQARDRAQRARDEARESARQAREQFRQGEQGHGQEHEWGGWPSWTDWPGRRGWPGPLDMGTFRDLERLARDFTTDLRRLAWHSTVAGEDVVSDLRGILEEALERIKVEIFHAGTSRDHPAEGRKDPHSGEGPETSKPPETGKGPDEP
jgi:DNA-binding PadR family transcriptional regulator